MQLLQHISQKCYN